MPKKSIIRVVTDHELVFGETVYKCSLGRSGRRRDKKEGDGATPVGLWPMRSVLYRGDRLPEPATGLPVRALRPEQGWCDAPSNPDYNRPVEFPFAGSAEPLWREDHIYDIIVILGYNDDPVLPGRGSAIFFHLATPDFAPTEGCVAVSPADMIAILQNCGHGTFMEITG